jgi:hypothetical protein
MPVGFLAPLFLAGLAALAIPVLVHLTHREKREPVAFPSLMFLQQVPFRSRERQRIRHWLLFALRAAAVALLVAAFARPFVARRSGGVAAGERDVVLLVDRSASMSARGRWERAVAAAQRAVAELPSGARMAVVAFDDRGEALTELTRDRAVLRGALAALAPGSAAGRFGPALQLASSLLERGGGAGDVVLISDFQRSGWDGSTAVRLPAGASLRAVDVGDTALVNTAVSGVVLERESGDPPRTVVSARLAATGGGGRDVAVALEVDGRVVQAVSAHVEPGATAVARFAPLPDPAQPRRARVRLPADEQPADDAWHLILGPANRLSVLLLTRREAPARDVLFVSRALAVARDPAFPLTVRVAGEARPADLAQAAVVILHDAPVPGGDAGRRLTDWVESGGGLLVALGAGGSLPPALADSLRVGASAVDAGELGATAAVADPAHPVFAGWAGAALDAGRAFRYRRLDGAAPALARYDDGAAALAESRLGRGRVLVWTADFANRWSDLPLRPAFVPLLHGAVRYLARFTPPPAWHAVGDVVEVDGSSTATLVVEQPDGSREAYRERAPARLALRERGFYAVRRAGERGTVRLVAANVPAAELDPGRLAPEQLTAAVAPEASRPPVHDGGAVGKSDPGRDQRLWWYLLAAVVALFAAETAVTQRLKGAA